MKYYLFAGAAFYPYGGMGDFVGEFDDLDSAKKYYEESRDVWDWCEIARVHEGRLIREYFEGNRRYGMKLKV